MPQSKKTKGCEDEVSIQNGLFAGIPNLLASGVSNSNVASGAHRIDSSPAGRLRRSPNAC
jgi:hypothetical protein